MEFQRPLFLLFLFTLLSSSQALKFNVGGSQGWVPNPSESYNNWAGRNRFQINDSLVFKYKKGSDSVLEVKKEDYDKCNKTNPIKKFENGDTEFKFDRSGPFYFISGKDGNCEKGQKLIVVVLSPRTPPSPKSPSQPPKISPSPSPSPKPKPNPPTVSPPAPSPTSPSPAISPAPYIVTPASAPGPAGVPTASSPGPVTLSPSEPPVNAPSTSPSAPAPETGTGTPVETPISSPPAPQSPSPSANATAPASKNSGSCVSPSIVLYSVTIVVGSALLRY